MTVEYRGWEWRPYVPAAERRAKAQRELDKRRRQGRNVSPVRIEGRAITKTFWGKAWCENLERYSDYANRLPRGRTYVRNGSVLDLQISKGEIRGCVCGTELYEVVLKVALVREAQWKSICQDCAGAIDSVVELLQGRLSRAVMDRICREKQGLFPLPAELQLSCSCPDWAGMCKHVAAVLYGVGARFDQQPELLFRLRGVDETELIANAGKTIPLVKQEPARGKLLSAANLSELFGLDIAESAGHAMPGATGSGPRAKNARSVKARGARKQRATSQRRRRAPEVRGSQRPVED